jgi:hypothetical protein
MDPVDIDEILKRAHQITHGPRGDNYGPPHEDYARVAAIFNAITGGEVRDSADAALFMIAMKLARIGYNREKRRLHVDSVIDAAGYLWVYAQCAQDLEHDITE